MSISINPIYFFVAYGTVGISWWIAKRHGMAESSHEWFRAFILSPITAPFFWVLGLFWLFGELYLWRLGSEPS